MLKYLLLENFVKHKHTEITFEKGMTAIVGKNGGGKSLIQEAIRFALFGTAALRGKLENYDKNLRVFLRLEIAGVEYEIDRTLKDCKFNGVVGTTWCNKVIEDKLGFGMNVFDMGCCAKQFEITKLGDMKPTERKQAVDKLIGLDRLELLRKEIKQTVSELRGRKEGLERYCVEPTEPARKTERSSEEIKKQLDIGRKAQQELEEIVYAVNHCGATEPTLDVEEPEPPVGSLENAVKLKYLNEKLEEVKDAKPIDDETMNQIELSRMWAPYKNFEEPKLSKEQIEDAELQWKRYDLWINTPKAVCPKCGCEFTVSGIEEVSMPLISKADISEASMAWLKKETLPTCEKPKVFLEEDKIKELLAQNDKAETKQLTESQIVEIGECASVEDWNKYDEASSRYHKARAVYHARMESWKKGQEAKKKLTFAVAKANMYNIESLEAEYRQAVEYETEYKSYKIAYQHYQDVKAELEVVNSDLNAYKLAEEGIMSLKSKIKSYVVPSLQKEASRLVSEMTNAELNEVNITDDFDITVNGKELALLSGSEKAVANLAIRLGLGCVLTRKVFNVFMGDEIDESMSEERAERVAESLHRLLGTIDQIILISHKDITADYYFSVDNV